MKEEAIDLTKPLITRNGKNTVRIISSNRKHKNGRSVIALVADRNIPGTESIFAYREDGWIMRHCQSGIDLVNRPEDINGETIPFEKFPPLPKGRPIEDFDFLGETHILPNDGTFHGWQMIVNGSGRKWQWGVWSGRSTGSYYIRLKKPEPELKYWKGAGDLPRIGQLWIMEKSWNTCRLVTEVGPAYMRHRSGRTEWESLESGNYRWNEYPFDKFEHGKECTINPE